MSAGRLLMLPFSWGGSSAQAGGGGATGQSAGESWAHANRAVVPRATVRRWYQLVRSGDVWSDTPNAELDNTRQ